MNKQPLISVIIPVYKVEEYLDECISSVVSQTYENLEIILVDDGSPDSCPVMCDEWANKVARIQVIHKNNSGLAAARNSGLAAANGEYISFVDSDDVMAPSMLKKLYTVLEREEADIAECNFLSFQEDDALFLKTETPEETVFSFDTYAALKCLLLGEHFNVVVWNKLYKREIFDDLRFEEGKIHEDNYFTWQAFAKCKKVVKTDAVLYAYRQRPGSTMGRAFTLQSLDCVDAFRRQYHFMKTYDPELASIAQRNALGMYIYLGQKALREADGAVSEKALSVMIPVYRQIYDAQAVADSKKQRIWYHCARKNFERCCKVRNLLKIGV